MCGTTTARGRNGGTWWERRLKRSPRPRRANTLELRAKSRAERIALLFCVRPRFPGFAVPCSPIHGAIFLLPCSLITGEFLTMRKFQMACLCTFLFVVATAVRARPPQTPAANYAGCEMAGFQAAHLDGTAVKFNIILPHDYAATGRRFPVLYLLHGFSGHYSDWCRNTRIVDYVKPYEEIIVMPEGENSWYVNNATNPKMQWEDYIIEDLIPYVDAHYRTITSRQGRAIAGLSMGGYGAMFLGLKYHEMFAAVASLSGVLAHDVHTAGLLGIADLLSRRQCDLAGVYTLLFQPAEEGLGGAKAMIEGGVLTTSPVDVVIGAHVSSLAPLGFVGTKPGVMMSEAASLSIH